MNVRDAHQAWQMQMANAQAQVVGDAPNPSVRQMTSMCFQAASKVNLSPLTSDRHRTRTQDFCQP
jgi:hypothetical protein